MAKDRSTDAVAVLAATARKLIEKAGAQQKVGGKKVAQTTLSRWARGGSDSNPRLAKLQELASSQKPPLHVWQLLVPDFDPDHPPKLAGEQSAGLSIKPHEVDLILSMRQVSAQTRAIIAAVIETDLNARPQRPRPIDEKETV